MTMQFISHRFPEDHDPTIGKSEYHLCFTNKPHKSFFVSVFETVLNHLYFDPLLVPKQTNKPIIVIAKQKLKLFS